MAENEEQAAETKKPAPKKPKEKKPKKEKPKKPPKGRGEKSKKEKKPLSAGQAVIFTALVFLLITGGVVGVVAMDVGGSRAVVASMLQGGSDAAKSQKELELMAKEKELTERENELAGREKTVSSKQTALDKKEKELNARDALLLQSEQDGETSQEALKQLATVYSRMEPASAAEILSQIKNKQDVTDILIQMQQNKVADILSAMTPELASEITLLMKNTGTGASPGTTPGTPTPTPAATATATP